MVNREGTLHTKRGNALVYGNPADCEFDSRLKVQYVWIAQQVEQWTENPCRAGSIPAPDTKYMQD